MNLAELAEQNIETHGEYVTLIFEDREYTNVQMHEQSRRLASGLKNLGIKPGDRVMVLMPNRPEVLISYPAVWRIGAVVMPLIFLLESHEITYVAGDSEAVAIVTSPEFLPKIEEARETVPSLKHVIVIGDEDQPGTVSLGRLVEDSEPADRIHPTDDDDMAVLLYTSGTTGRPKGVMLTHKNLHAQALMGQKTLPETDDLQTALSVLPLSHSYGLGVAVGGYISRSKGKSVLLSWFDLEAVFGSIEKYRVDNMAGVPTMFIYMLNYPEADKYDVSSMKYWLVGAAPMPAQRLQEFEEKFSGTMYVAYGLTEASPGVTAQRKAIPRKPGSVGRAFVGVDVKIFDENDKELPPGTVGEVVARGDNIMKGYYKMPEETERTLHGGWLHTGDMGYLDEDGDLYLVERKRDLIIRGGFNIFPKDIEDVLYKHPAISEAAAVGKPDDVMGEEVVAYVVLRPGARATTDELVAHCQSNLAKYKCPRRIEFIDTMPKNPIGKIQKKELRKMAAEQS